MDWKNAQDALNAIHSAELESDELGAYELSARSVVSFPDSPELWARRAKHLWNLKREDESAAAMQKAFAIDSECAVAWAVQSCIAAGDGRLDEALEASQHALALAPDNPLVLYFCADVCHVSGDATGALELATRWCRVSPSDPLASLQYIGAVTAARSREEGVRALDEAERLFPDSVLLMRRRALYTMSSELAEAIRLFRICADRSPGCSATWSQLTMALVAARRYSEAEQAAKRALDINPRAVTAMQSMARMYSTLGKPREAAEWVERAKNAIPGIAFSTALTPAGNAGRKGRWREVLALVEPVLGAPSVITRRAALVMKARALVELGRMSEAERTLDELEQMGWDESDKYELRGRVRLARNDRDGAAEMFREGLAKFPTDGLIAAQLISVWQGNRAAERERESLVQGLLDNPPDTPWGLAVAARALLAAGYRQQALKLRWICQQRFPQATDYHMLSPGDWFRHVGRLLAMLVIMRLFGRKLLAGQVPKCLKGIVSLETEETDGNDKADG